MDKVKLGFVGAGFMGQVAHLANYALLDECDIVALAEPKKEQARKVATRYGIKNVYSNHQELLENEDIDAIVTTQPFKRHIVIVPEIIKAKIPVFTEKPLAVSVEAGQEMVKIAQENNVLHMVGYHKRSDLAMEYARSLINQWNKEEKNGKMQYIRITMPPGDWVKGSREKAIITDETYPEGETEQVPTYFNERTLKRYKRFVNYYIHQVNALRFLFAEPYNITYANEHILTAESESGVTGIIEMAPYSTSEGWEEKILVGFEKGYIKINLPAPLTSQQAGKITIMQIKGEKQEIIIPALPPVAAMLNQASNFLAAVKGQKKPPCNSKEALEDLKIAKDYINYIR